MRKLIAFVHISLDGFVAGPNGEMDWIKINEEIFEYVSRRICKGDTSSYGRKTFELMEGYWPEAGNKPNASQLDIAYTKWYNQVRKVVFSKTLSESELTNTKVIGENLTEQLNELKKGEGEDILLFGSPTTVHALLKMNLIDGFWLFVNPIILGKGIALFEADQQKLKLNLVKSHQLKCGVVELDYVVDNN